MKHATGYAVLALALTIFAGCNSEGDEADAPPTDEANGPGASGAPVIWGEPATDAVVNSQYLFLPESSDDDGDVLSFSIVNKPAWAEFNTTSGQLQGVPESGDIGEYSDIVISVTDDNSVVSLAGFSITVALVPGQGGDGDGDSAPPTISGEPNKAAVVGAVYAFQPETSDPDGDSLSFSIVNKPSWASFDTVSGRLQGEPASGDLGQSEAIELSVTDGSAIAALTPFTITVGATGSSSYTVSWIAPTENEDGTPLTDLAGYRIYYGTVAGEYTETIEINETGLTSYVIDNLTPGKYFLVMTSVNSQAMESRYSSELEVAPGS